MDGFEVGFFRQGTVHDVDIRLGWYLIVAGYAARERTPTRPATLRPDAGTAIRPDRLDGDRGGAMPRHFILALAFAVATTTGLVARGATPEAANRPARPDQSGQTPDRKSAKEKTKSKAITMVGCVSQSDDADDRLTIADEKDGTTYRLSGTDLRKFVGRKVEIVGGVRPPPVHVRFGLVPSPNVAAQAGSIDPAQAAIAAAPGGTASATGNVTLPEFHVTRVRAARGSCP